MKAERRPIPVKHEVVITMSEEEAAELATGMRGGRMSNRAYYQLYCLLHFPPDASGGSMVDYNGGPQPDARP